ncbi:MAG TPA: hypothetical protein VGF80_07590 [Galbitalea sp.]|jgi:hypothetical protein
MNKFSKKSAFGIATVGAAAALVAGFAAPAMASTTHAVHDSSYSSKSKSTTESTNKDMTSASAWADALRNVSTGIGTGTASNWSPVVVSPSLNAPISAGDIGSGNALLSGNEVPVLSGNDVQAPLLSGNDTAIGNNDGNVSNVGNGDLTGGINTSVNNLVNSLTKDVGNNSSSTSSTGIVDSILGGR